MSQLSRFAIDAGGSTTRALVVPIEGEPQSISLPSVNPSARGEAADGTLRDLFARVRDLVAGSPAVGWLACASIDPTNIDRERNRLLSLIGSNVLGVRVVLSNDAVPLLWSLPALAGRGVVVVCGTGAGFVGGDGAGRIVRAGGCEYLGSDEGSAFDLGLAGLRAAIRATDGRGPDTQLVAALAEWGGCPVTELARSLSRSPYPKQRVAAIAATVSEAWIAGDGVATGIVHSAIAELLTGVRAVSNRLGLSAGFAVAGTGGVFGGCPRLFFEFSEQLSTKLGVGSVELIEDNPKAVLTTLTRLLGPTGRETLPMGMLDQHAWMLMP